MSSRQLARVLSTKSADAIWAPIGHSKHADDQRIVVGFGRADRPVARFDVGNQPVNEDLGRVLSINWSEAVLGRIGQFRFVDDQ